MPNTPPPAGGFVTDYGTYGTTPAGGAYGPGSGTTGPGPTDGGGGGTGDTGGIDYSQLFAAFGMPPDMIVAINKLMAQYISSGMDETTAYDNIIAQIRGGTLGANYNGTGMSWYQYVYGGIQAGMATGLLDSSSPEAAYRDYVNAINNYYKEYLGRDATRDEVIQYLQGGLNIGTVAAQLKGQSYANAYANSDATAMGFSWNALLGAYGGSGEPQQLDQNQALALGESFTGYSNPLGDQLQKMLTTAQRRMETIFRGQLATPADLQKGGSGLKAPSLASEPSPDTGPI